MEIKALYLCWPNVNHPVHPGLSEARDDLQGELSGSP